MTVMQLKYFLSICEYGKIRVTADRLHVSETAISASLKRLEEELGTELFTRDRRGLTLTEDGRFLRDNAAELVTGFQRLETKMRQRRLKHPAVLGIGIPSFLVEYVFSPLFSEYADMDPFLQFEFVPGSSQDQVRRVENGQLELAICDRMEVTSEELEFVPLLRSEMMGFVCAAHPFAGSERATAAELAGEKLLAAHESAATTKALRTWFSAKGIEPDIFMYTNKTNITVSLIKKHNAVAFFLNGLAFDEREALCSFPLSPPLLCVNGVVRKRGKRLSKESQRFFDFCIGKRID